MSKCQILLSVVLLFGSPVCSRAAGILQDGDLVAVCGDSITEQKIYSIFIADYLLMCQPRSGLQAIQAGWSGETAAGFAKRVENDVLPFRPSVVTTCYGMNDGGYEPLSPARASEYREATQRLIESFKAGGVRRVVVGGPGVVDSTTFRQIDPAVYNKTLAELTAIAREVAQKNGVEFADLNTPMMKVMAAAKARYGPGYHLAGGDGIHPAPNGHLVMAYAFLKALGCEGSIGNLEYDMKNSTATATEGHAILSTKEGTMEVESTKYPFCFFGDPASPDSTRGVLDFLPFNEDLNRFILQVKNAPKGIVNVTWGSATKPFSSEELARGINLAAEFPDNPFCGPFRAVETLVTSQQKFETPAIKGMMHAIPEWRRNQPELEKNGEILSQAILQMGQALRNAGSREVKPVRHTISLQPVK